MRNFANNDDTELICSKIDDARTFLKSIIRTLEIKDGKVGFLPHTPFDILQKNTVCHVWSGQGYEFLTDMAEIRQYFNIYDIPTLRTANDDCPLIKAA